MKAFLPLLALWSTAGAQSIHIDCLATDQPTMWPTASGSGSSSENVPPHDRLIALLSGTYEVQLVTTEGTLSPIVSQWRILILPVEAPIARFGSYVSPLFVGTRTDVRKPTPADSLLRGHFIGHLADFEMGVDSATGNLSWETDPGMNDSGWYFTVAKVDSTGFRGRWQDGGIAVAVLHRDRLTVAERAQGYYCAKRVR